MAAGLLAILSFVCLTVHGLPNPLYLPEFSTPSSKNTIFGDERLPGQIFEDVDAFDSIHISARDASNYRLPHTTKPKHYKLLWVIDMAPVNLTLSGKVEIELEATQASVNEIVIHSHELFLSNIQLSQGNQIIPTTNQVDSVNQLLKIKLDNEYLGYNEATPVKYILSIEFSSIIRTEMNGMYKSWFKNSHTDDVSWMASTHFQATAARLAFPCYDEPSFKATFDVTIRRQATYRSWFCTRLDSTGPSPNMPGFQDDIYTTTPEMSTYLLAVVVAEYESLAVVNDANQLLMHEVIARPGALHANQGEYALTIGQKLLSEMSNITGYDFYLIHPNLKMTHAAIPDFNAGAMENFGLLTYREAYLMYDEKETNSLFKQRIAYILSHEIAHMWFGNLVTCDWWDNLWLNEGFARYYQYYLTNNVEGMGFDTRFIVEQVHSSLLADSANNPHPLTNPGLNTNPAVRTMFSTITYNKGASVIRMTEHLLGYDVHLQGLRKYLEERKFKTATPMQLFNSLDQAGKEAEAFIQYPGFSFIEYYKSWTEKAGHPVLTVSVNHETGQMVVQQRRFYINGEPRVDTKYIVPITFATASNPNFVNTKPSHIISELHQTIDRGSIGNEWVIFNIQQTGFYRVNYDDYTWDLIVEVLKSDDRRIIHEYNRAQIVDDVFQFARSGLMTYTRALNILSFLEDETDYAPWIAAMTGFNWLRNRLASAPTTNQFEEINKLIVQWSSKVMSLLTYNSRAEDSFMQSYLRMQLAPIMCNLGVQSCIDAAVSQFQGLRTNGIAVPVDNRNWVYCNGLRHGSGADFEFLYNRFLSHNVYTEKILILENLGCTRDPVSLMKLLEAIFTPNYIIRRQDYTNILNAAVNGNEENTQVALQFIQQNLQLVSSAFDGSVTTPLSYVIARLRSKEQINAFKTWATDNQQSLGSDFNIVISLAQSAEASINWAESVKEDINNFLDDSNNSTTTSEEPVTETVSNEPVTDEPVTNEPITDEPVTDEPVTDEPVTNEPVTNEPVTDEPVTNEPITDETVTHEPVTDEPSSATTNFIATSILLVSALSNVRLIPLF